MERTRELVRYVVGQSRPRHDETPRADRRERRFDPGVSAGRNGERLEERMLGLDALDTVRVGHDEPSAAGRLGHGREAGPSESAAPERRRATVLDHGRAVACAVEQDRLEVELLIQTE